MLTAIDGEFFGMSKMLLALKKYGEIRQFYDCKATIYGTTTIAEGYSDGIFIDLPKSVYRALYDMIKNQNYFVITTNVDHCFQKAGFDKTRLFYTQGDYGLFQCSEPCCQETFDNEQSVRQMMERQKDMLIPTELIPKCPHCGKPMTMNLRSDDRFVEDEGWHAAAARYGDFLRANTSRVLYLELGVGYNTPGIIKYPFWRMTAQNPRAAYACINRGEAVFPTEIEGRSVCIDGDIGEVLDDLR